MLIPGAVVVGAVEQPLRFSVEWRGELKGQDVGRVKVQHVVLRQLHLLTETHIVYYVTISEDYIKRSVLVGLFITLYRIIKNTGIYKLCVFVCVFGFSLTIVWTDWVGLSWLIQVASLP